MLLQLGLKHGQGGAPRPRKLAIHSLRLLRCGELHKVELLES